MKKNIKLILALVLSLLLVAGSVAMADTGTYPNVINTPHTLTITNTDENVQHTYHAYQIFKGNLDADEDTLSDIQWGDNVDAAKLIAALAATTDTDLAALKAVAAGIESGKETDKATARAIANELAKFGSTDAANQRAGAIDKFADILGAYANSAYTNLKGTPIDFTYNSTTHAYTASITGGDGYYFVVDDTTALTTTDGKADTKSKFLLSLVRDTTIVAKDTGSQTDKVIVEGTGDSATESNDNDAAIGDNITYKTTLNPVPDPTKYNAFKLEMYDTMEAGLTFTGIDSIVLTKGNDKKVLTGGTDYYYYVAKQDAAVTNWSTQATKYETAYPTVVDPVDAGAPGSKTQIRIVFKEAKDLILGGVADKTAPKFGGEGSTLTVNYKAVLNKNAELAPNSNDNTEKFVFSNNPNYDYEGDEIETTDPTGETPEKTVETYSTSLEILKVDGSNAALEGAVFTIVSQAYNTVLETGEEFVKVPYYTKESVRLTKAEYDKLAEDAKAGYILNTETGYYEKDGETLTAEQWEALGTTAQAGYTAHEEGAYWLLKDGSYTTVEPGSTVGGRTVNDTQYASITDKYDKVAFSRKVSTPVSETFTITSGADGYIKLEGIKAGTYTITEIQAPDGYNLLEGNKVIKIGWTTVHGNTFVSPEATVKTNHNGGFSLGSGSDGEMQANGARFHITIENQSGATLPSTGGIGTTIFYIAGSILVLAAAILLITKRRMGSND